MFLNHNQDIRPADYTDISDVFRPSHADFTYFGKYGIRDYRGGGRASGRETWVRVVGGAFAKMILQKHDIRFKHTLFKLAMLNLVIIKTNLT